MQSENINDRLCAITCGPGIKPAVSKIAENARRLADNLLYSYSALLFLRSRQVGAILLFTTFLNPNLAASGVVSWLATIIFARAAGIEKDDFIHAIYTYNSLLVGFSVGFLFKFSFLSILLTAGTSILTVLLSYSLFCLLYRRLGLPVLNIPFVIVSGVVYLASVRYSSLFVDSFYAFEKLNIPAIPSFLQGLLRSAGILVFMPYDIGGILVLTALLAFSRISFFLAVSSYYIGITVLAVLKGSFANAFMDCSAFNFMLTGMALGGVYLVPSRRGYAMAFTGVFVSVFIMDAVSVVWSSFGIPVFALPYNIVVLLFVYVLINIGDRMINRSVANSPEKSLSNFLNHTRRFDCETPRPFLPFIGKWTVYQGFDDRWTHKGPWKYAYDFVIKDENGKTFKNNGLRPEDYHCFGKPVLSPVAGVVTDASDELADNPVGRIEKICNWGNYVIIRSAYGYHVEISHLQYKSLKVKIGDTVRPGTVIGNCGNSGNSPQPHIHIQVQNFPQLGSETRPFCFENCKNDRNRLTGNETLETGAVVEPAVFSGKLAKILTFVLDDTFAYEVLENGEKVAEIRLKVKMDADASYYLELEGTDDRLWFGVDSLRFVFRRFDGKDDSPLKHFFAALPRVPLCADRRLTWEENLPDDLTGSKNGFRLFCKSFNHNARGASGKYTLTSDGEVFGTISNGRRPIYTKAEFDGFRGISKLEIDRPDARYEMRLVK